MVLSPGSHHRGQQVLCLPHITLFCFQALLQSGGSPSSLERFLSFQVETGQDLQRGRHGSAAISWTDRSGLQYTDREFR